MEPRPSVAGWPAVLPRDHLTGSLLLLIAESPAHGYDLPGRLASLGLVVADRGMLYRALRILEAEGLLSSTWDDSPGGPRRRTYRVTAAGLERAGTVAAAFRDVDDQLAAFLSRYRRLVHRARWDAVPGIPAAG